MARTFQWITAAVRPLSLKEVQEAVAFNQDDTCWNTEKLSHPDKIIGSCQNLVILQEDGKLCFAHHTVRSFLLSRKSRTLWSPLSFDLETANIHVAMVCVTYLCFADFEAQIVHRPQETIQPSGGINSGGLHHLTRTLGISDLWFSLPYRLLGGSPRHPSTSTEVKWTTASPKSAVAPTLTEKYKLLDYAIQNWLLHTKDLPPMYFEDDHCKERNSHEELVDVLQCLEVNRNEILWVRFSALALERVMGFDHCLWTSQSNYKDLPFDAMFRWALENAHLPLLTLLELPPRGPPLIFYLQRYLQNGLDILRTLCIRGEIEVLKFLVHYCHENRMEKHIVFHEEYLSWCASLNGHTPVVKLLLSEGAGVNTKTERPHYAPNIDGFRSATALQLAVWKGHNEVVDVLLTNGASINQWNHDGLHPLHYVPNAETAGLLLRKGADVNISALYDCSTDYPLLPIHTAAAAGRTAVVERLLGSGAIADALGPCKRTPLQYASDSATARIILGFDCDSINSIDSGGETCLIRAASKGSSDLVKLLCDRGASTDVVDHQGQTALHRACTWGHAETVRVLLAYTCQQINGRDIRLTTPLHCAVACGHADVVSILLQAGADARRISFLQLHDAARRGDAKMVDLLLGIGIPVDKLDFEGRTALQCAIEQENCVSVVQLLIERQAMVNLPAHAGLRHPPPLIAASVCGHVEIVKMLLKAGANCDTLDDQRRSALFHAVDLYHYEIARLLIAHNANPSAFAFPRKGSAANKILERQNSLQILEDRREETDREMSEYMKSYYEEWMNTQNLRRFSFQ